MAAHTVRHMQAVRVVSSPVAQMLCEALCSHMPCCLHGLWYRLGLTPGGCTVTITVTEWLSNSMATHRLSTSAEVCTTHSQSVHYTLAAQQQDVVSLTVAAAGSYSCRLTESQQCPAQSLPSRGDKCCAMRLTMAPSSSIDTCACDGGVHVVDRHKCRHRDRHCRTGTHKTPSGLVS